MNITQASANDRCLYRTPRGRCRFPAKDASGFCPRHSRQMDRDRTDLTLELLGETREFRVASDINQVLGKVLILYVQGRITSRRASVFTYIISQLLRTLPALDKELGLDEDLPPFVDISELPRPIRDPLPQLA